MVRSKSVRGMSLNIQLNMPHNSFKEMLPAHVNPGLFNKKPATGALARRGF
jgi:hypothetical protein